MKEIARGLLRRLGLAFPQLRPYAGRAGVGRWLAPGGTIGQIRFDFDIVIALDLSVPMFRHVYYHYDLDKLPETLIIRKILQPSDTFVDVGAPIGYFALLGAKYAQKVLAFEPGSAAFALLEQNLLLNPGLAARIEIVHGAVGDQVGTLEIYNSRSNPDLASLQPIDIADQFTETVEVITLDEFLGTEPVNCLKIDVEGGEIGVLKGAAHHLRQWRPSIVCELFEARQQRFGCTVQELIDYLTSAGYVGFLADADASGLKLIPLHSACMEATLAYPALFLPQEHSADYLARLGCGPYGSAD
jgi:FkbM family methyltransferase